MGRERLREELCSLGRRVERGRAPFDADVRMLGNSRSLDGQPGRGLFRQSGGLFVANVFSTAAGAGVLAILARSLGPDAFGIWALMTSFVIAIDRLVNFQAWQALIKFGADALHLRDDRRLGDLVRFGIAIDAGSAAIGWALTIISATVAGRLFGWSMDVTVMLSLLSVSILFKIVGTPTALLRLVGRFDTLALHQVASASVKLLVVGVIAATGPSLMRFVVGWVISEAFRGLLLMGLASHAIGMRGLQIVKDGSARRGYRENSGLWRFVWTTNVHSSVKSGLTELDVLLLGVLLDASAAGMYRLIKQAGSALGLFSDPVYQVIYPDMSRAVSQRDRSLFRRLLLRPGLVLAAVVGTAVFLLAVAGAPVIRYALGQEYVRMHIPAILYLVGVWIGATTIAFHPALLALGQPGRSLRILGSSTLVYFAALAVMTNVLGLFGAGLAYAIFYGLWAGLMIKSLRALERSMWSEV